MTRLWMFVVSETRQSLIRGPAEPESTWDTLHNHHNPATKGSPPTVPCRAEPYLYHLPPSHLLNVSRPVIERISPR